jgi:hypothetical protein
MPLENLKIVSCPMSIALIRLDANCMPLMKRRNRRESKMRRLIVAVVSAFAFSGLGISVAHADPAILIDPAGECGMLSASENGFPTVVVTNTQIVATTNENGITTYKCRSDINFENETGQAVVWNFDNLGLPCQIRDHGNLLCSTEKWRETISKSGRATLTCRCSPDG